MRSNGQNDSNDDEKSSDDRENINDFTLLHGEIGHHHGEKRIDSSDRNHYGHFADRHGPIIRDKCNGVAKARENSEHHPLFSCRCPSLMLPCGKEEEDHEKQGRGIGNGRPI